MPSDPTFPWLARRIAREWRMKLWLGAALAIFFCAGYFGLQRLRPTGRTLPLIFLDRWTGFSPAWAWAYQSIYLLFPTAWLAGTRGELWRYAAGFVGVSLVGFACFWAWPVAGPRPAGLHGSMYGWVVGYDGPTNSIPSLHVALATFCALFAARMLRAHKWAGPALAAWVALIAWATLATKQHYALDLLPAVPLGWAGYRLAFGAGAT